MYHPWVGFAHLASKAGASDKMPTLLVALLRRGKDIYWSDTLLTL
jgi:hypothetical protein